MTRPVLIDLRRDDVTHPVAAVGRVQCVPTRRRDAPADTGIILPAGFDVALDDGRVTVHLEPTGPDWCWQITERTARGTTRHVAVPAGDPEVVLHYRDLPDVDPATLVPVESAVPAWEAAVEAVHGYAGEAAGSAGEARDAAAAATGAAQEADDRAGEAEAAAAAAEGHATAASGSATAASSSASTADIARAASVAARSDAIDARDVAVGARDTAEGHASDAGAARDAAEGYATDAAAGLGEQVVSGEVAGDALILTRRDGTTITAGDVRGPQGDPGPENTLTIGTVTTGAPGTPAAAEITGDSPEQALNLTIPRGPQGDPGVSDIVVDTSVGTRVFANGIMIYGDTGPRNVSSLLEPGWEGDAELRRTAEGTWVDLRLTVSSDAPFIGPNRLAPQLALRNVPATFLRHVGARRLMGQMALPNVVASAATSYQSTSLTGITVQAASGAWAAGDRVFISGLWLPPASWPTTLPGTPA